MPKKLRQAVDLMAFKYRTGKGYKPKKHRPTVDLMAFKCRTLKVNGVSQYLMLSVFYFKLFVKLWKSTIITVLELTALFCYKILCDPSYQKIIV
jgi:hypothetical protein